MKLIYLKEAVDFSSPESFIKEIKKGTTGLSPSILKRDYTEEYLKKVSNEILETLKKDLKEKANIQPQDINSIIIFFLKKFKQYNDLREISLFLRGYRPDQFYDTLYAYYKNKNKKEFKEDERAINLKKKFEDMKYPFDNDTMSAFEHYCTEKFVEKATIKDDSEIEIVYNKNGWEVVVPKTFAAAKKFACMNSRKAKWCTAAQSHNFNNYTRDGNKLFIIRNKSKDVMFQMDWGSSTISDTNFMDEEDNPARFQDFLKHNPPKEMVSLIKNKEGVSLDIIVDETIKEEKFLEGWIKKEYSYLSFVKKYNTIGNEKIYQVLNVAKKIGKTVLVFTKTIRGKEKVVAKFGKDYYYIENDTLKELKLEDLGNYIKGNLELKKTLMPDVKEDILKVGAKKTVIYKSSALLIEKLHNKAAIIAEIKHDPIKEKVSLKKELLKKEKSNENTINNIIEKSTEAIKVDVYRESYANIYFLILIPSRKIIDLKRFEENDGNIYNNLEEFFHLLKDEEKIQLFKVMPDLKERLTKNLLAAKYPRPIIEGKSIKIYEKDPRTNKMFNLKNKANDDETEYIIKYKNKIYVKPYVKIVASIKDSNLIMPDGSEVDIKKEFSISVKDFIGDLINKKTTESSYSKEYLDNSFKQKKEEYKRSLPVIKNKVLNNIKDK